MRRGPSLFDAGEGEGRGLMQRFQKAQGKAVFVLQAGPARPESQLREEYRFVAEFQQNVVASAFAPNRSRADIFSPPTHRQARWKKSAACRS